MRTARVRVTQMTGLKVRDQPSVTSHQTLPLTLSMCVLLLTVHGLYSLWFPSSITAQLPELQHRSMNVESKDKTSCEDLTRIWQLCHKMKSRAFDGLALSATSEMLICSRLTTGCRLRGMTLDKDAPFLFMCCSQCLLLAAVGGKGLGLIQPCGSQTLL